MNILIIQTLLRQGLTMLGATLVASGYATGEQWTAVSGGLVAGVSVLWGLWNAKTQAATTPVAKPATPVKK